MKHLKKLLCILLTLLMVMSSCFIFSYAQGSESTYVADYDTETPVVVVHGMSQNNTYLLDENGNRVKKSNGKYVTGWPLEIDVAALLKSALPNLIKSIFTRKDDGLSEALYNAAYEALYVTQKDNEGNYLHTVEVPCYECPMSELSPEVKEEYYKFLPIQELGEIIGEDKVYYFGYDSIGNVFHETEKLHNYIHNVVLPQTGAKQIKICHISLGGTIAVNYLETYPEDYELIKKLVLVVPAIDGSNIIGDLLTDNLSTYNDEDLYHNIVPYMLGDTPLAYLVNILIRILPSDLMKSVVSSLAKGVANVALRTSTILWALCPTEYYEEAREIWIADEEYSYIREKVDSFMKARANFKDNLFALRESGAELYDVSCYGVPLFPLCKDYSKTNADKIIHSASTSLGATFADLGTTLGENYKAAGTYCSDPSHNHLSPDGVVDATTGLLPCSTWYFKGQSHELLPYNDVCLKLTIRLITDNNMKDVYSNPKAFPQFNTGRITRYTNQYIKAWEEADKRFVSKRATNEIENAIADIRALEKETVVDIEKWTAAEDALEKALVKAHIIENTEQSFIEKTLASVMKEANLGVNKLFPNGNK